MNAENLPRKYAVDTLAVSPVTGEPLVLQGNPLFEAVNKLVAAEYTNHDLASLIRCAEDLGMSAEAARRATNEALRLFIAQKKDLIVY
jgi:hypothetical protein